ncbi:MAG: hypothetical protein H6586_09945 [Flavobacteriales bacterium]|nr:hypothetical protein [Flavobacteriales bacterium]
MNDKEVKIIKNYNEAINVFDLKTNIEFANKLKSDKEKILFYDELLRNYKNKIKRGIVPDQDLYSNKPSYKKAIKKEIQILNDKIGNDEKGENSSEKIIAEHVRDKEILNNQLAIAHNKIKKYNKIKYAKIDYDQLDRNRIQNIADNTRKRNGKLNFSRIAAEVGFSDNTVRRICKELNIH